MTALNALELALGLAVPGFAYFLRRELPAFLDDDPATHTASTDIEVWNRRAKWHRGITWGGLAATGLLWAFLVLDLGLDVI